MLLKVNLLNVGFLNVKVIKLERCMHVRLKTFLAFMALFWQSGCTWIKVDKCQICSSDCRGLKKDGFWSIIPWWATWCGWCSPTSRRSPLGLNKCGQAIARAWSHLMMHMTLSSQLERCRSSCQSMRVLFQPLSRHRAVIEPSMNKRVQAEKPHFSWIMRTPFLFNRLAECAFPYNFTVCLVYF